MPCCDLGYRIAADTWLGLGDLPNMEAVTKRVAQQSEQTEDSKRLKHDCTGSRFPEMVKKARLADSVKLLCLITVTCGAAATRRLHGAR